MPTIRDNRCEHGRPWYCVLWIVGRKIAYQGQSIAEAAEALCPGSCWGKGSTAEEAYGKAAVDAIMFEEQEKRAARRLRDAG